MPRLDICLLGKFQIKVADQQGIALHQPRLQSLLAYLLLHRDTPHSRRKIAFLFWPDVPER